MYTTLNARRDLAKIIAQHTSGLETAIPEQADYQLAIELIEYIEKKLKE